jgi:coproporphyrinogen III oxidase-like Fe-S oxidoreductase
MRDDAWLKRRQALHDRYLQIEQVGDASRFAFLHTTTRTWTESEVAALWGQATRRRSSAEALNSLYVHVPFCKSICHFCNYDRLQPSSPTLLSTWLARVRRSLEVIGPQVRPMTFHSLFIGGGTPSVLPSHMLEEFLTLVDSSLTWHRLSLRRFEFDPAVMSRERLEVLARHGFQQLSFGIETLDAEVNASHNRGRQDIETIDRCFVNLRSTGFANIACDFLLGLEGTTPDGMFAQMETVLRRYKPRRADIYLLTPTPSYVKEHFGGSWDACWKHLNAFEAAVPAGLRELARKTGYLVRSGWGHHMVLERPWALDSLSWVDVQRLLLGRNGDMTYTPLTADARRPVNVVGLGRSARSVIFGSAAFTSRDPEDNPALEGPADYFGTEMDFVAEARSFLSHYLRDADTVSRSEFRRLFEHDMEELLPDALAAWTRDGTASLDSRRLRLRRQDRTERIRSLLWLVPEEAIEFEVGRLRQLDLSAAGVARLTTGLSPGSPVGDGHTFAGTEGTRVLLRTEGGEIIRCRVAPGLTEEEGLRLLPDPSAHGAEDSLRAAVRGLEQQLKASYRRQVRHELPQASPQRGSSGQMKAASQSALARPA